MPTLRSIDCHVHLVGDGSAGSGCFLNQTGHYRKLQAMSLLKLCGLPMSTLQTGLDQAYVDHLTTLQANSSLDAIVLLGMDWPHDNGGHPMKDGAAFYVPNQYLLKVCRNNPRFIPAVSIHPGRHDAMAELERCLAAGARILKLLPNVHNVNCSDTQYREFWRKMAEEGMILLAHTGGEQALPVLRPEYQNPEVLRLPLKIGVRVIAAHCSGAGAFWEIDYTDKWAQLTKSYPHLYGDNSAIGSVNRVWALRRLLPPERQARMLHGSDFPVPPSPLLAFLRGLISWPQAWSLLRLKNPLEADYQLKRMAGFSAETFTRLDGLLRR